ncbi:ISWI chromatin-remodeling complex ATPase ISW2 [Polyplosphaeria fusca]|uniref:ISWI chromatin-remodeling complex ATPase ISW2 n=1 Tax=Polyplosphaeria fusca TaxID=682080 RepID=A0A9P4QTP1_9PLEO|nr:ISWI chromatin-remodeling complex ATPase ISW2 [Polyplosphaeria fusca]
MAPAPLSITPQKRKSGFLDNLLQSFGSRTSATSVTKARKLSARSPPSLDAAGASSDSDSKLYNKQQPSPPAIPPYHTLLDNPQNNSQQEDDTSEDELARSITPPPAVPKRAAIKSRPKAAGSEELKMELRRRAKDTGGQPRRSTRTRNGILKSDTLPPPESPPSKRRAPARTLPVTTRTRLHDDIANQSKAKADNFLVAHRDYFLPLLPTTNYITKLVASAKAEEKPIVEYKELTEQPEGVTATMKPYQLSGLSYLVYLYNNGFSGVLGDEMGLGKTLQTLSLFQYLEEQDKKDGSSSEELRPYLVVCPLSVLNSWVNEAQRWVPELKILRFHGALKERNRLKRIALGMEDKYGNETKAESNRKASRKAGVKVSAAQKSGWDSYKIIVTTYETFQAEQSWFRHAFLWRYAVLDEGHRIKNSLTNISTALKHTNAEYRLILTGTPLQNNLVELWALLAWLYPNVFTDNTSALFKESFDLSQGKVNQQTMDDARGLLELIMLRRMKDSPGVNLGLPPKEEVLLYVPLTPMQRFWYTRLLTRAGDALLDDLFAEIKGKEKNIIQKEKEQDQLWNKMEKLANGPGASNTQEWEETAAIMQQALENEQADSTIRAGWQKLMNLLMQLRKCCSHPYLLPGALPDPYYLGDHVIRASGKFIVLEKLLKHSIFNQGKKVLIFSGFTRTLDCCEDLINIIGKYGTKFKHLRLDGSTARARRNLEIRMFNKEDSEYKVMLLSTRAGGLGINLTSAEDVVFLDEDWNPQITLQAEARAHRIGQKKKVTIYKLCTQGTVEEQMMGRIRKKLYLSAKITESMRNIHSEKAIARGRSSTSDEMPQLDTTQLKTLVRRGAQTLSHPDIDVTEMLSWDLDTILQKCRDKPSDTHAEGSASEVDEQKWLSAMERVESAVFNGKKYHRQLDTKDKTSAANILPDEVRREDRRKGKNTTVMMNGFMINKESLDCADWEAVPTFAGKDPRLAEPQREKRRAVVHEEHCLSCFGTDGDRIPCKTCPRTYHSHCLSDDFRAKIGGFNGFHCPQHECFDCGHKATDAGGLIYRCRWCDHGFCEDCLDFDTAAIVGENLPEFEMLGEPAPSSGFFIACPRCVDTASRDPEKQGWMADVAQSYAEQHEAWLQDEETQRVAFEAEQEQAIALRRARASEDDLDSVPGLTDTSIATPVAYGSRVSTPPVVASNGFPAAKKRKIDGKNRSNVEVVYADSHAFMQQQQISDGARFEGLEGWDVQGMVCRAKRGYAEVEGGGGD